MTFDIFAIILAIILIGLGYYSGAITQVSRLVGVVLAFVAAPTVAAVFKEIQYGSADLQQPLLEWGLLVGAAVVIYLAVALLTWLGVKWMRLASEELTRKDRLVGSLLGGLKSVLIIYLAASSLLLIEASLRKADPDDSLRVQHSSVLDTVRDHQVVVPWALPDLAKLGDLLDASRDREMADLRDDPATGRVLMNDQVKALMADPAIKADDVSELLARPEVRELLTDPTFLDDLRAAEF